MSSTRLFVVSNAEMGKEIATAIRDSSGLLDEPGDEDDIVRWIGSDREYGVATMRGEMFARTTTPHPEAGEKWRPLPSHRDARRRNNAPFTPIQPVSGGNLVVTGEEKDIPDKVKRIEEFIETARLLLREKSAEIVFAGIDRTALDRFATNLTDALRLSGVNPAALNLYRLDLRNMSAAELKRTTLPSGSLKRLDDADSLQGMLFSSSQRLIDASLATNMTMVASDALHRQSGTMAGGAVRTPGTASTTRTRGTSLGPGIISALAIIKAQDDAFANRREGVQFVGTVTVCPAEKPELPIVIRSEPFFSKGEAKTWAKQLGDAMKEADANGTLRLTVKQTPPEVSELDSPLPHTGTTLCEAMSQKHGWDMKKTMNIATSLSLAGVITNPRTECPFVDHGYLKNFAATIAEASKIAGVTKPSITAANPPAESEESIDNQYGAIRVVGLPRAERTLSLEQKMVLKEVLNGVYGAYCPPAEQRDFACEIVAGKQKYPVTISTRSDSEATKYRPEAYDNIASATDAMRALTQAKNKMQLNFSDTDATFLTPKNPILSTEANLARIICAYGDATPWTVHDMIDNIRRNQLVTQSEGTRVLTLTPKGREVHDLLYRSFEQHGLICGSVSPDDLLPGEAHRYLRGEKVRVGALPERISERVAKAFRNHEGEAGEPSWKNFDSFRLAMGREVADAAREFCATLKVEMGQGIDESWAEPVALGPDNTIEAGAAKRQAPVERQGRTHSVS